MMETMNASTSVTLFTFFTLVASGLCCKIPESFCGGNELVLENYPDCGSRLTKEDTKIPPNISYPGLSNDKLYAVAMVDPDAPSPENPKQKYWLHWLVTDIQGTDLSSGNTLMKYAGPSPPVGTHRYQIILIEQRKGSTIEAPPGRGKYQLDQLMEDYSCAEVVAHFEYKVAAQKQ